MDEEKLKKITGAVWRELHTLLLGAEEVHYKSYMNVILLLLDSALRMFTKGDKLLLIKEYERVLSFLNAYVDHLKETYEIEREG